MKPIRLWFEKPVCRLIGCTSIFARWWEWPHGVVCTWMSKPYLDEKRLGEEWLEKQRRWRKT